MGIVQLEGLLVVVEVECPGLCVTALTTIPQLGSMGIVRSMATYTLSRSRFVLLLRVTLLALCLCVKPFELVRGLLVVIEVHVPGTTDVTAGAVVPERALVQGVSVARGTTVPG